MIRPMTIGDRVIVKAKNNDNLPYCIIKVLGMYNGYDRTDITVWLSLHKRSETILLREAVMFSISGMQIQIRFVAFRRQKAIVGIFLPRQLIAEPIIRKRRAK